MIKSDLPFGSEFSPSQIDLAKVLTLAQECKGDWKLFEKKVKETYFDSHTSTNEYNRAKLANNCKLGMIAYQLIDRDAKLTPFGLKLLALIHTPDKLYSAFAHHILLNLHGMTLIQCIQDIQTAGESVDLVKLRDWLSERGIHFPRGGKHPSIMRLWLEKAGIFNKNSWVINERRLEEAIGVCSSEVEVLSALTKEQRAYLKMLANIGSEKEITSNEIEKMASATYGVKFNEKNLPKQVLYPLVSAGYITATRGTKQNGRGAKPFIIKTTDKFKSEILEPLLVQIEKQVHSDIRPLLRKPLEEIMKAIDSKDTYVKGLALEALAFKLLHLIDLHYVTTRLRGADTGGAEVDLIFENIRLLFSRWQIQCKNTANVSVDAVAKEVGLTHALKSNCIVVVSTGQISSDARKYAQMVMQTSHLDIILLDKTDLQEIIKSPVYLFDVLDREARHTQKLKKLSEG